MTQKIMLIKPAYETDAVWDTIRTSQPLGLWWIVSLLKERGHQVRILDETVRDDELQKKGTLRPAEPKKLEDVPSAYELMKRKQEQESKQKNKK